MTANPFVPVNVIIVVCREGDEMKQSILNILNFLPPQDRDAINRQRIAEAMLKLPARDRDILRMRYGLDGGEPRTQAQIAKELGMSQRGVGWRLQRLKRLHNLLTS